MNKGRILRLFGDIKIGKFIKSLNDKSDRAESGNFLYPDYKCSLPTSYILEPGNICNLKCPFCATGAGISKRPKGFLSLENFKIIFKKIAPYAKEIALVNYGEPFLNKNIYQMISMISAKNIRSQISSNMSLPINHEALVQSGLTNLIIAADGARQESYSMYRKGGDFDLVMKNIVKLKEAKIRLNSEKPVLTWRFLINKYNEHEQEKAKEIAAQLGIEIVFTQMICWDPSWESSLIKEKSLPDCIRGANLSEYRLANRSLPIPIGEIVLHPNIYSTCKQIFELMVINWDGQVYPCCSLYDDNGTLGNLLSDDLSELWNNLGYRKCRQFLYNYGLVQNGDSICETAPCMLYQKYVPK